MLVEDADGEAPMEDFDDSIGIAVVVNRTAVACGPYLKHVGDARGIPTVLTQSNP